MRKRKTTPADYPKTDFAGMTVHALARKLKVSPTKALHLKQAVVGARQTPAMVAERRRLVGESDAPTKVLAAAMGISIDSVSQYRREAGQSRGRGRPRLTDADFPADTDWSASTRSVAISLGIAWPTAQRIKAARLARQG